jgi:hypothetical protein
MPLDSHPVSTRRWTLLTTLGILVVGAALTAGILPACLQTGSGDHPAVGGGGMSPSEELFATWPAGKKPDVALILTGQQHSFLKFCGCTRPQLGGFERRYNFLEMLKGKGWPLVAADVGDLVKFDTPIHDQSLLKYEVAMKALKLLDYSAIGVGADDFALPLLDGMARYSLQPGNEKPRLLAANIDPTYRLDNFPDPNKPNESMIGDWVPVQVKNGPTLGIAGLIGRTVQAQIQQGDPKVAFVDSKAVLSNVINAMDAAKVDLKVLLFQGTFLDADAVAKKHFPDKLDVILCLSEEDQGPNQPTVIGKTMIIRVGHRGRWVGVVGGFRTGNPAKPFDLHYQYAPLGEAYETPKGQEAHNPILKLLDYYALEVKNQDFLKRVGQRPVPVPPNLGNIKLTYVGSDACMNCHQPDFAIWKNTKHSHAIDALTKVADKPGMRQHDPECIKCHVVGYAFHSGFDGKPGTKKLSYVGCESCHGPGSAHALAPNNPQFKAAMSPWKTAPGDILPTLGAIQKGIEAMTPQEKAVYLRVNDMCQKCHDIDNDPNFQFAKNWPQVIHGKNAKAAVPAAAAQK